MADPRVALAWRSTDHEIQLASLGVGSEMSFQAVGEVINLVVRAKLRANVA